jgi:hypothetical protein
LSDEVNDIWAVLNGAHQLEAELARMEREAKRLIAQADYPFEKQHEGRRREGIASALRALPRIEELRAAIERGNVREVERLRTIRREAQEHSESERARSLQKARYLWSRRTLVEPGTPPWAYLRERRRYQGVIPATLGYLPSNKPEHHPALISAFGLAHEPAGEDHEPGTLALEDAAVRGVHLTLLRPDGSDKANVDATKIIVGQGSTGTPIVVTPPNDLLSLAICEGVENALSLHESTGLGAWAAGCANRLPALADAVPGWIDTVTIAADADPTGLRNAQELRAKLLKRGLRCEMAPLANLGRAA